MTLATVPQVPTDEELVEQLIDMGGYDRPGIDWHAVGIVVLTAIPIVVAFTVGFADRCIRLIVAASIEAYRTGRGLSHEDDDLEADTIPLPIPGPPVHPLLATLQTAREANRR